MTAGATSLTCMAGQNQKGHVATIFDKLMISTLMVTITSRGLYRPHAWNWAQSRGVWRRMWPPQARRLLFISLEYERGCFSGNGVYAQSQVYFTCCCHLPYV